MSENTYPSVNDLTLEEKASLTSGGDAWHLQGVEAKGIPGYMITDGPHGLRKSNSATTGEVDLNNSVPATCFPPAAGLSSSWNPELIHPVGEAMAEECIQRRSPSSSVPASTSSAIRSAAAASNIGPKTRIWPAMRQSASSPACSPRAWAPRSSTSPPTTGRPTVCAYPPTSPSGRCARSTSRLRAHRQNRPAMDHHVLLQPHQRRAFRTKPLAAHRRAPRRMGV